MSNIHGGTKLRGAFGYARGLSCHVSGFTPCMKQNTFAKVYKDFVNSTTASSF